MEVGVLGPLRVADAAGDLPIPGAKERTVLGRLAASVDQVVAPDDLVDALWPDGPPRTAVRTLQVYVARLRAGLARDGADAGSVIVTAGRGYRLALDPMAIDAHRFARLVELGRSALQTGHVRTAIDTFGESLGLWRGPAYSGFEATAFGRAEARRLDELRLVAQEGLWAARIASGDARGAIPELAGHTTRHPLREPAWALLVRAHAAVDDQAAALAAVEDAREVLAEELGVDPGEELRTLQARVLAQDPALRPKPELPAELVPPGSPLVGRSRELDALRDHLAHARAGSGRRVLVLGGTGSGRWRLACELAVVAQSQGARVAVGALADPGAGLRVLDLRRDPAVEVPPVGSHELQLVVAGQEPVGVPFDDRLHVGPLSIADVGALLGAHAGGRVENADLAHAAEQVYAASGGNAAAAERMAIAWVRDRVAQRVAQRTAHGSGSAAAYAADRDALARDVEVWTALQPDRATEQGTCPWRGLAAYAESDSGWFAGRERLTAELLARVAVDRALLLVGASGSGKSSLLRAGLLASLAAGALPGSAGWVRIVLRPGAHPMRELTRAALSGAAASGPDRVADLLSRALAGRGESERVLLVVDQFEECWTVCSDPGEREAFLDALAEVAEGGGPVSLVLAVRADHAGRIAGHPGIAAALAGRAVFVGPMVEGELRRAIEDPAARAGLSLDTGLADALVADTLAEPGGLPLLSTAVAGLWEQRAGARLTLTAYAASGGVGTAVARLAEQAYADLDGRQRVACRVLLRRLAGPGQGDGVVRRRVALAELRALPDPNVAGCVDALASARLLTVSDGHVEVAHEALFRSWPRLRDWLAEDATARDLAGRLTTAAADWDRDGRDLALLWTGARLSAAADLLTRTPGELTGTEVAFIEASTARLDVERASSEERARAAERANLRLRRLLGGVVVTLAVALVAGGLAVVSRNEASAQRQSATAQRLAAAALTRPYLADRMLTAVEALRTEESPETLGSLLSVVAGAGPAVERFDSEVALQGMDAAVDGRYAVATSAFEDLYRLDMATGQHQVIWSADAANLAKPKVSPDGRFAAFQRTSTLDGAWSIDVIDVESGNSVWSTSQDPADLIRGGFDFTGRPGELAIAAYSGLQIHRFDRRASAPTRIDWPRDLAPVTDFLFLHRASDGQVLLMGTPSRPAWLVDVAARRITEVAHVGTRGTITPDGRRVVSQVPSRPDGRALPGDPLLLVDLTQPEADPVSLPFGRVLTDSAFTPDGRTLLAGAEDGTIEVIDVTRRVSLDSWAGHGGLVQGVTVSADGRTAWSAGRDGDVIGWDLEGSRRLAVTRPLPGLTVAGNVSDDGRVAAVWDWGSPDEPSRISAVDLATREVLAGPFPPIGDLGAWQQAFAGATTPDGRTLVVALGVTPESPKTSLQLVDVAARKPRAEVELPWWVSGVDVSPDGRAAVVAGVGGVAVVDLADGRVIGEQELPAADVPPKPDSAVISPDGRLVALARKESVLVLDTTTLAEVASWATDEYDGVLAMQWLPDGRTLAYGGVLGTLAFRSIPDGGLLGPPRKIASGFLLDLAISPDGRLLASADSDGTVTLWDAATQQQVGQPLTHVGLPWAWLSFTPDSRGLEVFLENATSVRYDLDTAALLARACAIAGREPTAAEWSAMHGALPQQPTCGSLADGDLLASP